MRWRIKLKFSAKSTSKNNRKDAKSQNFFLRARRLKNERAGRAGQSSALQVGGKRHHPAVGALQLEKLVYLVGHWRDWPHLVIYQTRTFFLDSPGGQIVCLPSWAMIQVRL